jgi:phage baseplate assembly protein gpV
LEFLLKNAGDLNDAMRRQALLAAGTLAGEKDGTITSYDPNAYAVKVMIQPDGYETGWIPLPSVFVGNGYGAYFGPEIGQAVSVTFADGDKDNGRISKFFFNNVEVPIKSPNAVQSGEILLQDKAGNMIRWSPVQNKLIITANKEADLNVGTNLDVAIQGNATITVTGNINLTAAGGDITVAGISLVNHVHTGGTLGGGDTGPPVA